MNKRNFIGLALCASLVAVTGCASEPPADPGAKRRSIDASVELALSRLSQKSTGTRELIQRARGVLVFPDVLSAGLVVGGSHGDGALLIGGRTSGYYTTTSASLGLTAGAQTRAVYILFLTDDALRNFRASSGWTAGVDASVALLKIGANGAVDTETVRSPVVGFILSNEGVIADLSLEGSKITRLSL
jgi:lipid-binding SYLF domain-containing protein